jgi:hypothetical protein
VTHDASDSGWERRKKKGEEEENSVELRLEWRSADEERKKRGEVGRRHIHPRRRGPPSAAQPPSWTNSNGFFYYGLAVGFCWDSGRLKGPGCCKKEKKKKAQVDADRHGGAS